MSTLHRGRSLAGILVAILLAAPDARAQMLPVGDTFDDYARVLQITGKAPLFSYTVRPYPVAQLEDSLQTTNHPWVSVSRRYEVDASEYVHVVDASTQLYHNSARPGGQNDGAVWQGRGTTTVLAGGAFARWRMLRASVRPTIIYNANRRFELSPMNPFDGLSRFAYPTLTTHVIDWPQRYGDDAFWTLRFDQSYIRAEYRGFAVGWSNENMWWGPGTRNSIIMSNNAPGFPHVYVASAEPADIWIGKVNFRWIWGHLYESEYFDDQERNDKRFLTGIGIDFTPRWIEGLYVGVSQAHTSMTYPTDITLRDYFNIFQRPFSLSERDQYAVTLDKMVGAFFRYVMPASGLEVFGEWAYGDGPGGPRQILTAPEYSRAKLLGMQKAFTLRPRYLLRLGVEYTQLEAPLSTMQRSPGQTYFYVHNSDGVRQGYTHHGQIIGAGIGPGSSEHFGRLDLFAPFGKVGIHAYRTALDNDRYYRTSNPNHFQHEIEFGFGISGLAFYKEYQVGASMTVERLLNKHYEYKNDETNVNMSLTVRRMFGVR